MTDTIRLSGTFRNIGLRAGLERDASFLCWETSELFPGLRELILKALDEIGYVWVVRGGDVGRQKCRCRCVVSEARFLRRKEAGTICGSKRQLYYLISTLSYERLISTPHKPSISPVFLLQRIRALDCPCTNFRVLGPRVSLVSHPSSYKQPHQLAHNRTCKVSGFLVPRRALVYYSSYPTSVVSCPPFNCTPAPVITLTCALALALTRSYRVKSAEGRRGHVLYLACNRYMAPRHTKRFREAAPKTHGKAGALRR